MSLFKIGCSQEKPPTYVTLYLRLTVTFSPPLVSSIRADLVYVDLRAHRVFVLQTHVPFYVRTACHAVGFEAEVPCEVDGLTNALGLGKLLPTTRVEAPF